MRPKTILEGIDNFINTHRFMLCVADRDLLIAAKELIYDRHKDDNLQTQSKRRDRGSRKNGESVPVKSSSIGSCEDCYNGGHKSCSGKGE